MKATILSEVLGGTRDQDTADMLARQGETSRHLGDVLGLLQAIVHGIEHYQHSLGTGAATAAGPTAAASPASSAVPRGQRCPARPARERPTGVGSITRAMP